MIAKNNILLSFSLTPMLSSMQRDVALTKSQSVICRFSNEHLKTSFEFMIFRAHSYLCLHVFTSPQYLTLLAQYFTFKQIFVMLIRFFTTRCYIKTFIRQCFYVVLSHQNIIVFKK